MLLASACLHEGYEITEASSASEMASAIREQRIDLVLAAEPLPRDGTLELVAAIGNPGRGNTPVLTLAADDVVQPIGSNDPLTVRLTRPIHWTRISETISDLIGLRGAGLLSETG